MEIIILPVMFVVKKINTFPIVPESLINIFFYPLPNKYDNNKNNVNKYQNVPKAKITTWGKPIS